MEGRVLHMKSPEEVKPFLVHDDPFVRQFAVRYFDDLRSTDPDLMPLVLQAVKRSSDDERRTLLAFSTRFLLTQETLDEIVLLMIENPSLRDRCERLIIAAPANLLESNPKYISQLTPEMRKLADQRRALAGLDGQALLSRLKNHSESGRGRYIGDFDYHFGVYIARELAVRSDAPMDLIRQWVDTEYPDDYDGYDDIYGCVLAGMLRFEDMVPRLIGYLHWDDADLLTEETAAALTRIGTEQIVESVASEFQEGSWHYRLWATDVLGTIKHRASEQAALDLLRLEENEEIRTSLAEGLCKLLSVEGIPAVQQVLDRGYAEWMLDLREPLYVNCVMNGIDLPQLPQWKLELQEAEQAYRERLAHERKSREPQGTHGPQTLSTSQTSQISTTSQVWNGSIGPETVVNPVKVGRNDPCPCGSGKKYKKCCGA